MSNGGEQTLMSGLLLFTLVLALRGLWSLSKFCWRWTYHRISNYHRLSKWKALKLKFNTLLGELSTSLTEADIEQIRELVDAGELGVAFENFCTQLYEWDAVCSREQIDRIAYIGKAMGIKPDYWQNIATR
jgi:hypothetical protein